MAVRPGARIGLPAWQAAGLVLCLAGPLLAGFGPPLRVTAPDFPAGAFHLGLDYFENVTLAHAEGPTLVLETRAAALLDRTPLGAGNEPHLAFVPLGVSVAFSAPATPEGGGRTIFLATRQGSRWNVPVPVSDGEGEDHLPCLGMAPRGVPVVAWERWRGNDSSIFFRRGDLSPGDLGPGTSPAVVIDGGGRAHIFFLRDGDIFHARESFTRPGELTAPVNVTGTPAPESAPAVALLEGNTIYLCFERGGEVLLASNRAGSFSNPARLAGGATGKPSLAISPGGAVAVAFAKDGDIHAILGTSFFLPGATPVLTTPEVETDPAVTVDSFANVYVAFKRDGTLFYVTDAGPPQAAFEATPQRGEAPLTVQFTDRSRGDVTLWSWDFGDGTISHQEHPLHTYAASGEYAVRLRVSGPGGESPLASGKTILVLDPGNEMRIPPMTAFPGHRNLHVPVLTSHEEPAQGFTIAAVYDPAVITVKSVIFEHSNIAGLLPELFAVNISEDPVEPFVTAGILFDVGDPFDGRVIEPGLDQRIANIIVDVDRSAVPGSSTRIELRNQVGRPALNNIFTVNGFTVLPILTEGGVISVGKLHFPLPQFFRRGDADSNGLVNITDAIVSLNYLFSGGEPPGCLDAADVTDDGAADVSDAVFLLGFLFKAGSYPAPPFPDAGLDPTPDALPDCLLR